MSRLSIAVTGIADNEKLIFKLILSVSQRSTARQFQYELYDQSTHTSPDLVIIGNQALPDVSLLGVAPQIVVVNSSSEVQGRQCIVRPLIATRVLSALDDFVKSEGIGSKSDNPDIAPESQLAATAEKLTSSDANRNVTDEGPEEVIEFSITEEEASELAIVHDDTLTNPANLEPGTESNSGPEQADNTPENIEALPVRNSSEQSASAVANQTGCQVALVVDDSASVRKQMEIELELFDVNVDYAEDAHRAMELLAEKHYDVTFLDVVLPDMDGFEICKKIKADPAQKSTKVIMLTGRASHADKVRGSLAGCDAYLVKPVGRAMFQKTVKKYLHLVDKIQVMEAKA